MAVWTQGGNTISSIFAILGLKKNLEPLEFTFLGPQKNLSDCKNSVGVD